MTLLAAHASWVLIVAFAGSLLYELYRATAKAGTSRHDSPDALARQIPLYAGAAIAIGLLFVRFELASWIGLGFTVVVIGISILYYNPTIMRERQPGIVDWLEDLLFTGLLFVAAALLAYDVSGWFLLR
jgi:UDP-N-acetylmuramyl pentapeptide phosphotransferase/UDP-N-acetylglucosamine-1-phosphate transferase